MMSPFDVVIGQHQAKRSLQAHLVDPAIGGVLLIGPPGCGKTTLARATATAAQGPFVELPLGCDEERLLGGLDPVAASEQNRLVFRSGLLEQAAGGCLYVDEVNLLGDHLTDHLLDVASSGILNVERDGASRQVSCRFVLIGSMNPEEGALRPQLEDRFAHHICMQNLSAGDRLALLHQHRDHLAGHAPPPSDDSVQLDIEAAQQRRNAVLVTDSVLQDIAERCTQQGIPGHRRELAVLRTAIALAALDGSKAVEATHTEEAWGPCRRPDEHDQADESPAPPSPPAPPAPPQAGKAANSQPTNTPPSSQTGQQRASAEPQHPAQARVEPVQAAPAASPSRSITPMQPAIRMDYLATWWRQWRNRHLGTTRTGVVIQQLKPELWHLVDGSRSHARFGGLRASLATIARTWADTRWGACRIALVHHNDTRIWRRADGRTLRHLSKLDGVGGSPLLQAVALLISQLRRARGKPIQVAIHSDGLLTAPRGTSVAHIREQFIRVLQRLQSNASLVWLSPPLPPHLQQWQQRMLQRAGIPQS